MFIKKNTAALAALLVMVCITACGSETADMAKWHPESASVQVQTLSVQGKEKADSISKGLCVIPKSEARGQDGINFASSAQLCINVTDKEKVYADNIYERLYPASVTKLFSAYVILKYGNLDDIVEVSQYAATGITETGAKLCNLHEGDRIGLRELLQIMLVYSANDAALAAAEYIGGSEEAFVQMMNEEAAALGAVDSHFVNSHGLHDEDHYTTAYDIYIVLNTLIKDKEFRQIMKMEECRIVWYDQEGKERSNTFTTTNRFFSEAQPVPEGMTVLGAKTGTTMAAGGCLAVYSKGKGGKKYISVILKAPNGDSAFSEMKDLLALAS